MKIPTFEEAKQALIEKRGTPLDKFAAYWEPAWNCEEEKFREMLRGLVDFVELEATNPPKLMKEVFDNLNPKDNLLYSFWNPTTFQYEEKK